MEDRQESKRRGHHLGAAAPGASVPGDSCRLFARAPSEPQGPCLPAGPPELLLGLVGHEDAAHAHILHRMSGNAPPGLRIGRRRGPPGGLHPVNPRRRAQARQPPTARGWVRQRGPHPVNAAMACPGATAIICVRRGWVRQRKATGGPQRAHACVRERGPHPSTPRWRAQARQPSTAFVADGCGSARRPGGPERAHACVRERGPHPVNAAMACPGATAIECAGGSWGGLRGSNP